LGASIYAEEPDAEDRRGSEDQPDVEKPRERGERGKDDKRGKYEEDFIIIMHWLSL
jgi:hypothetical protein